MTTAIGDTHVLDCTIAADSRGSSVQSRRARRMESFHPAWRRYIAALTACSPELEDLADSFPALLFALVSGYADPRRRARGCGMVAEGAPLRQVAEAIGLPLWLRRLPASAFASPIPPLPCDADFVQRISNLLPGDPDEAAHWLASVGIAVTAAGPEYALWIARQSRLGQLKGDTALLMGAWAWFSQLPGGLGHRLLRKPWCCDMSLRRAAEELALWRSRLRLVDALGLGLQDCWLAEGSAGGLQFVALRTVEDFLVESEVMENCLDQYADQLRTGRTTVFSVRRGQRRIACLEIGMHDQECSMPAIIQLRAARNRRAAPDVWQATFAWLGGQRLPARPRRTPSMALHRSAARQKLWQPFLQHVAGTDLEGEIRRVVMVPARGAPSPASMPASSIRNDIEALCDAEGWAVEER